MPLAHPGRQRDLAAVDGDQVASARAQLLATASFEDLAALDSAVASVLSTVFPTSLVTTPLATAPAISFSKPTSLAEPSRTSTTLPSSTPGTESAASSSTGELSETTRALAIALGIVGLLLLVACLVAGRLAWSKWQRRRDSRLSRGSSPAPGVYPRIETMRLPLGGARQYDIATLSAHNTSLARPEPVAFDADIVDRPSLSPIEPDTDQTWTRRGSARRLSASSLGAPSTSPTPHLPGTESPKPSKPRSCSAPLSNELPGHESPQGSSVLRLSRGWVDTKRMRLASITELTHPAESHDSAAASDDDTHHLTHDIEPTQNNHVLFDESVNDMFAAPLDESHSQTFL